MKHIFTAILIMCGLFVVAAQDKTILTAETQSEGQLWSLVEKDYASIDSLRVVGPINRADFKTMWKCCYEGKLTGIDLSEANPENNLIPDFAFLNKEAQADTKFPYEDYLQLNLQWITLPSTLTTIGESAFSYTNLKGIRLPDTLTEIGESAFFKTYEMDGEVVIPVGVTEIPGNCFTRSGLKKVTLSPNVKKIGYWAFNGSQIQELEIPEGGLEFIDDFVFQEAFYLKRLILPNTVSHFGIYNLQHLYNITEIKFGDAITELTEGGDFCCGGISELRTLTLPKNLKKVSDCFSETCVLRTVYAPGAIPAEADAKFLGNCHSDAVLYVPMGSGEAYRMAEGWKNVKNIVETSDFPYTGVQNAYANPNVSIIVDADGVVIIGADGEQFVVVGVDGKVYATGVCSSSERVNLQPGIYVVKTAGITEKVMI